MPKKTTGLTTDSPASPETLPATAAACDVARVVHANVVPAVVYSAALAQTLGDDAEKFAQRYAQDVIDRMQPRDPLEEMLIAQILFTHARVTRLTSLANSQTTMRGIRTINEYADRASNTYRRLMLALADYRAPARTAGPLAVVQQANFAAQQVIHNHEGAMHENATNEQGSRPRPCHHADAPNTPASTSALPPDTGGP